MRFSSKYCRNAIRTQNQGISVDEPRGIPFRRIFRHFLMENGIESTPLHIGPTECAIQNIVAMVKHILEAQKLKKSLWMEAMVNAAYALNRCPTKALYFITPEEMWSERRPCVAHMRMFGSLAYAMVSNEKRGKLNAKAIKCMFLGYCGGTKVYRVKCFETKKIIKYHDVVFMEDSGSIKDDLEMHPSGKIGGPTSVVMVDESSKSPLVDGDGRSVDDNEQMGDNGVIVEQFGERATNNDIIDESFGEEKRYPTRERQPLGHWWKNHTLPQRREERANMAILEDPLSWNEAIRNNMRKFMSNVRTSLYRIEKLRNSIVLQVFDYSQSGSVELGYS